jgi:hypothetical protein
MENADLTNAFFQLVARWFAETPKNMGRRARLSDERDEQLDGHGILHVSEYHAVSAVTSSPFRPAIQAVAVHMQLRWTRYMHTEMGHRINRRMRHIEQAVQYIDILGDEQNVVMRVRVLAHAYQVLAETFARFLGLHPRWRRQASELRAEAEDTFAMAESSDDDMDED